jgi:hypothetical protein
VTVDEDPNVIVSNEAKHLAFAVVERGDSFQCEMKVVRSAFVSIEFIVDGKEIIASVDVEIFQMTGRLEGEIDGRRGIDSVDIAIPLIEIFAP